MVKNMRTIIVSTVLALFAGAASAQLFLGAGSIGANETVGGTAAGSQSTSGSLSAAAPGAGLTFGYGANQSQSGAVEEGYASNSIGVDGTQQSNQGGYTDTYSGSESVTAGGSLGTAASLSLGGGDAASIGGNAQQAGQIGAIGGLVVFP
jgi:hypothetical protein